MGFNWQEFNEKIYREKGAPEVPTKEILRFFDERERISIKTSTEEALLDEQLVSKMEKAVPNYDKWSRIYHLADAYLVFCTLLVNVGMFIYKWKTDQLLFSTIHSILIRVLLPFVLGSALVCIGYVVRKKNKNRLMGLCYIPILINVILCLLLNLSNPEIPVVLCFFSVPSLMTVIFWNRKMLSEITLVCSGGIVVSALCDYFVCWRDENAFFLWISAAIALLAQVYVTDILRICLELNNNQRNTLVKVANEASEAEEREKSANESKSAFLASMSHEIRTPINAVLGMDEMILRESESPMIRSYAEGIMSSGNNLLYLINDILDISKIESGKFEIVDSAYDVSSMIHDCHSMVAERMKKKNLEFILQCDETMPRRLKGDEYRVRQVVTNILTNAAKYTEQGSVTLSIGGKKVKNLYVLTIAVKDTGIGIKEEDLDRLFGQFTRFDTERNRNVEGSGLGLSITKQLTKLMGGDITVESVYGKGSTFTIEIPQTVIDDSPLGTIRLGYQESATSSTYRYAKTFEAPEAKILVVDDVTINLRVFAGLLKETHMQVETADSGARALEMIGQKAYDIIFLDHMMPGMDGIEVFKKMKEDHSHPNQTTPVIMLTANAVSGAMDEYIKAGFTHYLSKPVKSDHLESVIRRYLPADKLVDLSAKEEEQNAVKVEMAKASSKKTLFEKLADGEVSEAEAKVALKAIYKAYPIMSLKDGKQYCGNDMELYLESIQMMVEDSHVDELEHYMEEKDMKNYAILIHGFKSSSRSIGCNKISDLAAELEAAAKVSNRDFVEVNHVEFMEELEKFFRAVKKVINE